MNLNLLGSFSNSLHPLKFRPQSCNAYCLYHLKTVFFPGAVELILVYVKLQEEAQDHELMCITTQAQELLCLFQKAHALVTCQISRQLQQSLKLLLS